MPRHTLVKLGVHAKLEAVALALEHQITLLDRWTSSPSSTERLPPSQQRRPRNELAAWDTTDVLAPTGR
jgi:hypothetical protein